MERPDIEGIDREAPRFEKAGNDATRYVGIPAQQWAAIYRYIVELEYVAKASDAAPARDDDNGTGT
jgi:hypothetical protein